MTRRRDGYAAALQPGKLPPMLEDELQTMVIETAERYGWRVHHGRPAQNRNGKWLTPIQGHAGFPDLALARDGRVLLVELKSDVGKPSADQVLWLEAAGDNGRLWAPKQWHDGTIQNELRRHR